ncbi:MAG TPA: heme-binding protein [Burkholderiaceae bacterium]|jgi:uncharacterized protein GlcG (DUF336 family)|nr:heme-binding protein [Burkholderiaceae bacterium]
MLKQPVLVASVLASLGISVPAMADTCSQLSDEITHQSGSGAILHGYAALKATLHSVVPGPTELPAGSFPLGAALPNGGLGFPMWLTLVDGSGRVCAITNSLDGSPLNSDVTADIWLASRVISAQKANTANSLSTSVLSLATANLYSAVQPGGSLFGLQESNPVDPTVAYEGAVANFGTAADPLVGERVGGVNVFGGGLALYSAGKKVGAIGVSGDTSCTDHVVAWKVRARLSMAYGGFGNFDKLIQDLKQPAASQSGFGHPECLNNPTTSNDGGSIVHGNP